MRVQSINCFNFNKPVLKQTQVAKYNQQKEDIVSFSAKKKQPPKLEHNPNIDFGVSVGDEILSALNENKSKKEVFNILSRRMPTVSIGSIDEIEGKTINQDNYVAFFDSKLNDDFTQTERRMYLNLLPFKVADEKQKLVHAMDIAHESTHAKQVDSGRDARFYKKLSDGDVDYARTVIGVGKYVFQFIDSIFLNNMIGPCFNNFHDDINYQKYQREIPRVSDINKQQMLKTAELKNYDDFSNLANYFFENKYNELIEYITKNPNMAEEKIIKTLKKIANENNGEKFIEDVKKYCSYMAMSEQEARTTECKLAKKALKTNKTLNIDCYPIYYEMLAKALK